MAELENIAMPTTGNPNEDRRRLVKFLYDDVLIKAGLCPNGCGPMLGDEEEGFSTILNCETCGFQYGKIGSR